MNREEKIINFWDKKIEPNVIVGKNYRKLLLERERIFFENKRSKKYYKQKFAVSKKVVSSLENIPWIVMVAVTGSVATEWPKKNDDIDFLVICKKNRLWLSRLVVVWRLFLEGFKLRNFSAKKKNRLCFNLWLEEDSLEIEKDRQNLLTAMDVVWMKVIFNKNKSFDKFLAANRWILKYVKMNIDEIRGKKRNKNKGWLDLMNLISYKFQYMYMKKKIRGEIVDLNKAYFHPKGRIRFDRI